MNGCKVRGKSKKQRRVEKQNRAKQNANSAELIDDNHERKEPHLTAENVKPAIEKSSASRYSTLCSKADPDKASDVYECMVNYGPEEVLYKGRNYYQGNIRTSSCESIARRYKASLQKSGIAANEVAEKTPSCNTLAQAARLMSANLYWPGCTNYQANNPDYAKRCLSTFIPGYYGQKYISYIKSAKCANYQENFLYGVRAATLNNTIPVDFEEFNCNLIPQLQASLEHLHELKRACIGAQLRSTSHIHRCLKAAKISLQNRSCEELKKKYEDVLLSTYGQTTNSFSPEKCTALLETIKTNSPAYIAQQQRIFEQQTLAILNIYADNLASNAKKAAKATDYVDRRIRQLMKNHDCKGGVIKRFESALLQSFDLYYDR